MIRACSSPVPEFKLPKRLARARRMIESKRMETFKEVHETLKKTAKEEFDIIKNLFDQTKEVKEEDDEDEKIDTM